MRTRAENSAASAAMNEYILIFDRLFILTSVSAVHETAGCLNSIKKLCRHFLRLKMLDKILKSYIFAKVEYKLI